MAKTRRRHLPLEEDDVMKQTKQNGHNNTMNRSDKQTGTNLAQNRNFRLRTCTKYLLGIHKTSTSKPCTGNWDLLHQCVWVISTLFVLCLNI